VTAAVEHIAGLAPAAGSDAGGVPAGAVLASMTAVEEFEAALFTHLLGGWRR
jgi:hypothetical protein